MPPNFVVTTAAAVAVGHIMHIIAASITALPATSGQQMTNNPIATKLTTWTANISNIHPFGRNCRMLTLQKLTNNMANSSNG